MVRRVAEGWDKLRNVALMIGFIYDNKEKDCNGRGFLMILKKCPPGRY